MRAILLKIIAAAYAVCVLCGAASAQTGAPAPREETRNPDVSITARVTAGELLFRKVPNPRVEFTGRPERETVWEADRENLPAEVRPGVTYRDVGITLRIISIFPDIDRIVAEALGEVPVTEDAAPPPADATPATPPANDPPRAARSQSRARRGRRP